MAPPLPLAGLTVVVTRARAQAGELAAQLEVHGARILEFPTIDIRPVDAPLDPGPPDSFDWIVFTSANAVTCAVKAWGELGHTCALACAQVCAVGPATRRAAEHVGLAVSVVPGDYLAGRVPGALKLHGARLREAAILLPRGNIAQPELPEALRAEGVRVTEWIVYETACPPRDETAIEALLADAADLVTFTSASTAENFAALLGKERLARMTSRTIFASIGPRTTAAAQDRGISILVEPTQHDVSGLVEAIVEWARGQTNHNPGRKGI